MSKIKIGLTKEQIENYNIIQTLEYYTRVFLKNEDPEKVFEELKRLAV